MEIGLDPSMPTYAGGLGMLVEQGALAFELWTGRPAPVAAMEAAAVARLTAARDETGQLLRVDGFRGEVTILEE